MVRISSNSFPSNLCQLPGPFKGLICTPAKDTRWSLRTSYPKADIILRICRFRPSYSVTFSLSTNDEHNTENTSFLWLKSNESRVRDELTLYASRIHLPNQALFRFGCQWLHFAISLSHRCYHNSILLRVSKQGREVAGNKFEKMRTSEYCNIQLCRTVIATTAYHSL